MKKKLFLIALAILPLSACQITFTNYPGSSMYDPSGSSESSSSQVDYIQSVTVPEDLDSYSIVFNSSHTITQPNFETADQIYAAISVKDSANIVTNVTSFENVAYGPSCLVVKSLGIQIKDSFSYSYVTIKATPFYAKSFEHYSQTYTFVISSGALSLNGSGYIALDETHGEYLMNTTLCSFQTSAKNLLINALDERIFIDSITFHY